MRQYTIFIVVVLPAPLTPRNPKHSCRRMENSMPRTASTGPYRFVNSDAATAKSSDMAGLHSSLPECAP
jgi:hypothetical protein